MKTLIISLLLSISFLGWTQTKSPIALQDSDSINGHYIPKNLNQCFQDIEKFWSHPIQKTINYKTEKQFVLEADSIFHDWANQQWILWGNSRLALYFNTKKVLLTADMSRLILKAYYRHKTSRRVKSKILFKPYKNNSKTNLYSEIDIKASTRNKTTFNRLDSALIHRDSLINFALTTALKIPKQFKQFKNLAALDIYKSPDLDLEKACITLSKLDCLEFLYFYENNYKAYPKTLGRLKQLKTLWIEEDLITELPTSIKRLIHLEELLVNECPKINLATVFNTLSVLPKLNDLDLAYNELFDLPNNITQLKALETLWLTGNNLHQIPESVKILNTLNYLDLGDNKLKTIHFSKNQLQQLTTINLYYNNLQTFPLSLKHLKNLKNVSLSNNKNLGIPRQMDLFKHLEELNLENCNLNEEDKAYLKEVLPNTTLIF